jgi:hypothetical protein
MSKLALFQAASAADKAWMAEIARIFGDREAGRARFNGRATGERARICATSTFDMW